jgi:hypothetical protein
MLDADVEGADWREVARIVLQSTRTANLIERGRLSRAHLAHAKWMTKNGYQADKGRSARFDNSPSSSQLHAALSRSGPISPCSNGATKIAKYCAAVGFKLQMRKTAFRTSGGDRYARNSVVRRAEIRFHTQGRSTEQYI